jgi:hypothetical protein
LGFGRWRTRRRCIGTDLAGSAARVVTAVIAIAAAVLLLVIGVIAYSRRPRQDSGLTSFRRHIDALSPESRREVMDRVRPTQTSDKGVDRERDIDSQEPTD